jgi:DNA polymerase-3 subunit epsilon
MLRLLESIEVIPCATELEAAVTELRLIHAHRPRHNRVGRPARCDHWVTLTSEAFPRLSLARTFHTESRLVLGPFRSRRAAELVMTALWDAVPIRRCTGRPGSREGRCAPAQLGVSLCPCDGSLDAASYARVVDQLIAGVETDPATLLRPIEEKMRLHAIAERFEEAGWMRDRHRALAAALERRRRWQALAAAGRIVVDRSDGEVAVIDGGRFVASWTTGSSVPLFPTGDAVASARVAPTTAAATEADLIWRWMYGRQAVLDEAEAGLTVPARAIPHLEHRPDHERSM